MERGHGREAAPHALRRIATLSALTGGVMLAVLALYILYVYALWMQAMRAEGTPGTPPP
ncbi:MAG: hypothetical protein QN141_10275 [Armatimonadota bacterium]|nr:hypothetical protein [Armatimonadota bacterium]MDR7468323.1 hypothetical protein [Armatimonadota bacterium]MDR7492626.1 hypothetical protein [Armatimonadota bacterium]MDR7500012.1 hypothetical protein [Armatimonadota bacterium]MDR7505891.1 hypothetical protein [Armatimonadota bacterium]